MTIADTQLMTAEQLDSLPDDGRERWLINGELRESGMTRRNRGHSRIEAKIAALLVSWNRQQPEPRGEVLVGEAGITLRRNPDTAVGVDVAYLSPETADATGDDESYVVGIPLFVVEVLSPSDKEREITEKVRVYLEAGVRIVWIVSPAFRAITVHRPDRPPRLFNETETIDAEPHLPAFRVAVKEIFAR